MSGITAFIKARKLQGFPAEKILDDILADPEMAKILKSIDFNSFMDALERQGVPPETIKKIRADQGGAQ